MLGYGQTDMPSDSKAYSTKRLCDDLAALLDLLGIKKAVLIGHDWGAYTVGRFALWHPDRLLALIMLAIPYTPISPTYAPIEEVVLRFKDFGYQAYFADEKSTAEIDGNLSVFLSLLYSQPKSGLKMTKEGQMRQFILNDTKADVKAFCLLDDKDLQYYESQFKRGIHGPLSYYRTSKIRYEEEQAAKLSSNFPSDLPVLFLYGTADRTCPQHLIPKSHEYIPLLQVEALEGYGHWLMVEAKDSVATKTLEWLNEVLKIRGKL
jgi:soluble epoxide hydrolase/lipid-phosphate phosphatase